MLFSLIMHLFLGLTAGEPERQPLPAQAQPQAVAMQDVRGFDEATATAFAHRLPLLSEFETFGPRRQPSASLGVVPEAESALVIDQRTWTVLYDKSAGEKRSMASITKLMTALVLLEEEMDTAATVTVFRSDYRIGGLFHVFAGEEYTVQDLWMIGLISSDNVAISSLVRATGLTQDEFVQKMNDKAAALDMKDTSFVEPTGIDAGNVSTAYDIAKLLHAASQSAQIADALRRPIYQFEPLNKPGVRKSITTNTLLNSFVNQDPYKIVGGKTGFTYEAGYCMTIRVDGPAENDDVIVVLLGADSPEARVQGVKGLVDWTYDNYLWN